jgi:hypothetical protein
MSEELVDLVENERGIQSFHETFACGVEGAQVESISTASTKAI